MNGDTSLIIPFGLIGWVKPVFAVLRDVQLPEKPFSARRWPPDSQMDDSLDLDM